VFNVELLELYGEDPVGRPHLAMPAPEIVDSKPSYIVSEVVDSPWYGNPVKVATSLCAILSCLERVRTRRELLGTVRDVRQYCYADCGELSEKVSV